MLELKNLSLRYGDVTAVSGVSLTLGRGEIGCLVGPSGSGKSTILKCIAGFLEPACGDVIVNGRTLSRPGWTLPPEQRQVGMIHQDLALFPHLNVADNIGFGMRKRARAERRRRVDELLALTGLGEVAGAYPHEVSGGQQQRVAIARAMAPRPQLLLLDEPFSSLDPQLRDVLPRELRRLFREDGMTALLVTHDQREAFAMADQVGVIMAGRLRQWDSGYGLYHRPADRLVAQFIGEGVTIPGRVVGDTLECALGSFPAPTGVVTADGGRVSVLLRPDDVVHDDDSPVRALVRERSFRGSHFLCRLALADGSEVLCLMRSHHDHKPGERVGVRIDLPHVVTFPARD